MKQARRRRSARLEMSAFSSVRQVLVHLRFRAGFLQLSGSGKVGRGKQARGEGAFILEWSVR